MFYLTGCLRSITQYDIITLFYSALAVISLNQMEIYAFKHTTL